LYLIQDDHVGASHGRRLNGQSTAFNLLAASRARIEQTTADGFLNECQRLLGSTCFGLPKGQSRQTIAVMADGDDKQPPPPPRREPPWVPEPTWEMPPRPRNNALFDTQPTFVPPPQDAAAGGGATNLPLAASNATLSGGSFALSGNQAEFRVTRAPLEVRFEILQARVALLEEGLRHQKQPEIGPGHNQGPWFVEDLSAVDDLLIRLLKEEGPAPPSDPTLLIEQGEKALKVSERIFSAVNALGIEMVKGAAREIGKEAFIWLGLAQLILQSSRQ
jgi:hypothetical protein